MSTREQILQDAYNRGFEKGAAPWVRPAARLAGKAWRFASKGTGPGLRKSLPWLSAAAAVPVTQLEYAGKNPVMNAAPDATAGEQALATGMNALAFSQIPALATRLSKGKLTPLRAGLAGLGTLLSTPALRGVQRARPALSGLARLGESTGDIGDSLQASADALNTSVNTVGTALSGTAEQLRESVTNLGESSDAITAPLAEASGNIAANLESSSGRLDTSLTRLENVLENLGKTRPIEDEASKLLAHINTAVSRARDLPWKPIGYGAAGLGTLYGVSKLINAIRASKKKSRRTPAKSTGDLTPAQRKRLALELEAYERGRRQQ